ncbi:MAG: adenosylcobinamide-phosphate synthase CbiB [Rhodospirillaceae bacterium]|nr:adenosylcobinamide-phosphate synthase CbiB [Rhodospirillaceae bacterium]
MWFETNLLLLAAALLVEAAFGYPKSLTRRLGHPVMWIGALIERIEQRWNRPTLPDPRRRLNGVWCVAATLIVSAGAAVLLQGAATLFLPWLAAGLCLAVLASSLFAQRSLHDHVAAVGEGLSFGGLPEGRKQVSHLVGRDPETLDEAGVARAAIESLAENFSDGVTAPAIWCALFGLPGAAAYKAINTADSMIGHRNERYGQFGRFAARLDDLVNLPASRLSAGWIVLAAATMPGASPADAIRAVWRDARHHHSPNAGWPEAAMAGALGLRLGGPRQYAETFVDDPWMGDGRAEATADDIGRALRLYRRACAIQIAAACALFLAIAL